MLKSQWTQSNQKIWWDNGFESYFLNVGEKNWLIHSMRDSKQSRDTLLFLIWHTYDKKLLQSTAKLKELGQ